MTATQQTGAAIKALRVAAGMTLEDVAEAAGISPSYLSRAENDLVTPTANWIQLVALAIGNHLASVAA
jgi:transcriptional regulator with XRE-family HTH domain